MRVEIPGNSLGGGVVGGELSGAPAPSHTRRCGHLRAAAAHVVLP